MLTLRALLCLAAAWVLAHPALSQDTQSPLDAIRSQNTLSDEDQARIRTFITEHVQHIVGSDPAMAASAGSVLRRNYNGSDAFRTAYARVSIEVIGAAYRRADLAQSARLIAILNTFHVVEAQPLLFDALRSDQAALRAAGAVGLRGLREVLVQRGEDAVRTALSVLVDAGKKEKSADALRCIYAAMNYVELQSAPASRANTGALLELLEARSALYGQADVPALGADDMGLRMAAALLPNMDDAQKRRLTLVAAALTRYGVAQYASPETKLTEVRDKGATRQAIERRDAVERLVLAGEEVLKALLKPRDDPRLVEQMSRLERAGLRNAWNGGWVPLLQQAVNQDFAVEIVGGAADEAQR